MLHLQEIDVQDSQQVEAENDDHDPSDTADVILIGNQYLANEAGGGPEGYEDRGETRDEQ